MVSAKCVSGLLLQSKKPCGNVPLWHRNGKGPGARQAVEGQGGGSGEKSHARRGSSGAEGSSEQRGGHRNAVLWPDCFSESALRSRTSAECKPELFDRADELHRRALQRVRGAAVIANAMRCVFAASG